MLNEGAPLCGNSPNYMFVRQAHDFMCQPDSTTKYGVPHCFSKVTTLPRGVDIIMGVSGPLYRRSMFDADFFDVPKLLAGNKLAALIERTEREEAAHKHGAGAVDGDGGGRGGGRPDAHDMHAGHQHVAHLDNERLRRTPPPMSAFLVDDVTISAYLARKGIPALVVPMDIPLSQLPAFTRPKRHFERFPAPVVESKERTDAIAALHGDPQFLNANAAASRYFHHLGWW
jgi:hypothetical protein